MSQAEEKDTECHIDPAPVGFAAVENISPNEALNAAYTYIDAVERALTDLAMKDVELDAVFWSLSYVASMAKAMVHAAQQGTA